MAALDQERKSAPATLTAEEARARLLAAASSLETRTRLRTVGPWTLVGLSAGAGLLVGYKPRLALSLAKTGGRLLFRATKRAARLAIDEASRAEPGRPARMREG